MTSDSATCPVRVHQTAQWSFFTPVFPLGNTQLAADSLERGYTDVEVSSRDLLRQVQQRLQGLAVNDHGGARQLWPHDRIAAAHGRTGGVGAQALAPGIHRHSRASCARRPGCRRRGTCGGVRHRTSAGYTVHCGRALSEEGLWVRLAALVSLLSTTRRRLRLVGDNLVCPDTRLLAKSLEVGQIFGLGSRKPGLVQAEIGQQRGPQSLRRVLGACPKKNAVTHVPCKGTGFSDAGERIRQQRLRVAVCTVPRRKRGQRKCALIESCRPPLHRREMHRLT